MCVRMLIRFVGFFSMTLPLFTNTLHLGTFTHATTAHDAVQPITTHETSSDNGYGASSLVWAFHIKLVNLSAYFDRKYLGFDWQLFWPCIWRWEAIYAWRSQRKRFGFFGGRVSFAFTILSEKNCFKYLICLEKFNKRSPLNAEFTYKCVNYKCCHRNCSFSRKMQSGEVQNTAQALNWHDIKWINLKFARHPTSA